MTNDKVREDRAVLGQLRQYFAARGLCEGDAFVAAGEAYNIYRRALRRGSASAREALSNTALDTIAAQYGSTEALAAHYAIARGVHPARRGI